MISARAKSRALTTSSSVTLTCTGQRGERPSDTAASSRPHLFCMLQGQHAPHDRREMGGKTCHGERLCGRAAQNHKEGELEQAWSLIYVGRVLTKPCVLEAQKPAPTREREAATRNSRVRRDVTCRPKRREAFWWIVCAGCSSIREDRLVFKALPCVSSD